MGDDEHSATTSPKLLEHDDVPKQHPATPVNQILAAPNADTGQKPVPIPTTVDPKSVGSAFDIGSTVEAMHSGEKVYGVVRWMGYFTDPQKIIFGIESVS